MAETQLLTEAADQLKRAAGVLKKTARRWWLIAICAAVGAVLGLLAPLALKPRFVSESVLLYREGVSSALETDRDGELERTGSRLREMLLSRARLQRVVEEFKLAKSEDQLDQIEAVLELRQKIAFEIDAGGAIRIAVTQPKPEVAQKLTARLSLMLIEENTRFQVEQAESSQSFISQQARDAERSLEEKQQAQALFLVKYPEFAQEQWRRSEERTSTKAASGGSRVSRLEAQLTRLRRIQRGEAVAPEPREPGSPQVDPAIIAEREAAMTDVTNSQRDVSEALSQFTEAHPDVLKAKRRLAAAQSRLSKAKESYATAQIAAKDWKSLTPQAPISAVDMPAVARQIEAVEQELAAARRTEASGKKDDSKSKLYEEVVEKETEWARLNSELNAAREDKEKVDQYRFVTSIQSQSVATGAAATISMLDEAFLPREATGPKKSLLVVIGFALMSMLGGTIALAVALLDDRFYEGADVERANIVPLLVTIPKAKRWRRRG